MRPLRERWSKKHFVSLRLSLLRWLDDSRSETVIQSSIDRCPVGDELAESREPTIKFPPVRRFSSVPFHVWCFLTRVGARRFLFSCATRTLDARSSCLDI